MTNQDIVIVAAKRTPIGGMLGCLSTLSAPELGAIAHRAAITQSNLNIKDIDEVISGCVLQAGIGQAPARQAALKAGIPVTAGATTINKMCGSGMKAVMIACDAIKAGSANIVLASGMESMSRAPYLLNKARTGYRLGDATLIDHMFLDGLKDAYTDDKLMGCFADDAAKFYKITRTQQDDYAIKSMTRALAAQSSGAFTDEIVPVTITERKIETIITHDELPDTKKLHKISTLNPVFQADGTVTAASSSAIADGAASIILMSAENAIARKIKPLARIVAYATHAQEPELFTTAPIKAIEKVLHKTGWAADEVDLYEINEAFAIVAMLAIDALKLDPTRVNIHGGGCALGHPIGASGARILITLLYALQHQHKKRGIAALCIGGGEATAMAIEMIYA